MIFSLKNIMILSWSSIHINDIFVPTLFLCGIVTYYILYFVISSNDLTLHGDIFVIVFCCTGCTLAWNVLLPAGLRVAQPCRYCFYSVVEKQVFRPAGATRCPDKREIHHEDRTAGRPVMNRSEGPLPRAEFHVYRGRNVGIQPTKLSKFRILAINFPLRGHSFAQFLRNSQILYASLGNF